MFMWSEWWWLAVLWPILLLGVLWTSTRRRSAHTAIRFPSVARLRNLAPAPTIILRRVVLASRVLVLILLTLAMARPQVGRTQRQVSTEGIDIMLVVDTSESMRGRDLDPERSVHKRRNRLEVVKAVVNGFVAKRPLDQIGMVIFGSEAYIQCPLTLDHGILSTFLDQVQIGIAGPATAIGDALGTAVKRLQKSKVKSKVIVLLTDGTQTAGMLSATQAAEAAKAFGIKVYSVGAGTSGEVPVVVQTMFGPRVEMHEFPLDEQGLRKVARITGGKYFRAENADTLAAVYDEIDRLEKTEITSKTYTEYDERFSWFVWPALGLLLLEILLLGTRLRKIP